MSRDPRATARACFELAAKGATEGERSAALGRGMAIVERHGLNPDHFAIPGRITGNRADRFIIDDPHDMGDPFMREVVASAFRRAAMGTLAEIVIDDLINGAFFADFDGAMFRRQPGARETAAQRKDREAAAKMDEHLRGKR